MDLVAVEQVLLVCDRLKSKVAMKDAWGTSEISMDGCVSMILCSHLPVSHESYFA